MRTAQSASSALSSLNLSAMATAVAAAHPPLLPSPLPYRHQIRFTAATPTTLASAKQRQRLLLAHLKPSLTPFPPPNTPLRRVSPAKAAASSASTFHGPCYVVGDNIDTDQIIPAQYLTLVPSKPDEYRKLGSFALVGLPSAAYPTPFVEPGLDTTRFPIIVAGANFGCGSSREHAPVALGAAGARAIVAESYARIFFRNSVATGEVYPVESEEVDLWDGVLDGGHRDRDLAESVLTNHITGKQYRLKPIGDAGPVIEAGGIFAYARQTGMIPLSKPD